MSQEPTPTKNCPYCGQPVEDRDYRTMLDEDTPAHMDCHDEHEKHKPRSSV
jgi:hypothetical protein